MALLRPIRYYVTRGSLTTPTCALHPRKTYPARGSRATLRRELARRQGIDRPAQQTQRSPDAVHRDDSSEPFDADAQPCGDGIGHRRSPPMNIGETRWSTRPGRPPSRRRNRPRATGKSGPAATSSQDAAALRVCVMNRTCVRRVRPPADGTYANRCLCARCAVATPTKWLNHADCGVLSLQRELRRALAFGPRCSPGSADWCSKRGDAPRARGGHRP